jgi:hypothetical protein
MLVLVGETEDPRHLRVLRELGWGRMFVNRTPKPYPGERWGLDNGAYRDWLRGVPFDGDHFLRRVERAMKAGTPYLAVAPDLVAGGWRSLEFSLERLLEYARWWAHVTRHEQKRLWPPTVGAPRPEEVQA